MTTATPGDKPKAATSPRKGMRPRDAATPIIIDRSGPEPKVLMGKRRMEQVFMPGKFVFPGGRVDKTDRHVASADELSEACTKALLTEMKGVVSKSRARALALAAVRETFEEAGIIVGAPRPAATGVPAIAGWDPFFAAGFVPRLSPLRFFARAITPPGRPRRYDTRFFYMDAADIAHTVDTRDGELSGLHWLTIAEARNLDLPSITRVILEDLLDSLSSDALDYIPYYHHANGSFRRATLPARTQAEP